MDARIRIGLLTALLGAALSGQSAAQAADSLPPGVTPALIEAGRKVYSGAGLCFACHGPAGKGTVGANLTDGEWAHGDGSLDAILRTIIEGVPAAQATNKVAMPPKGGAKLNDEQARAVAAYVWSFRLRASGR